MGLVNFNNSILKLIKLGSVPRVSCEFATFVLYLEYDFDFLPKFTHLFYFGFGVIVNTDIHRQTDR